MDSKVHGSSSCSLDSYGNGKLWVHSDFSITSCIGLGQGGGRGSRVDYTDLYKGLCEFWCVYFKHFTAVMK